MGTDYPVRGDPRPGGWTSDACGEGDNELTLGCTLTKGPLIYGFGVKDVLDGEFVGNGLRVRNIGE